MEIVLGVLPIFILKEKSGVKPIGLKRLTLLRLQGKYENLILYNSINNTFNMRILKNRVSKNVEFYCNCHGNKVPIT